MEKKRGREIIPDHPGHSRDNTDKSECFFLIMTHALIVSGWNQGCLEQPWSRILVLA